ncbi:TIGR03016 family PEP-CTERM system-associated outer membrane protein [Geomonas propionica]|uniref:TIGR03016 family PEP-CTERM system-associated outer membrane protein n=1 Tax=Geomonas propionica TaxID=2798582 RepID=A0ABS0YTW8_9BACT|nr:TIGR03016 family PEP-CTERM system-associated outer membrane protein [Geomonas propionica]MBJ6801417.1 TIGR03016 family PEP-CTERM system-associated outer membrane protein [Geomonas propionica]
MNARLYRTPLGVAALILSCQAPLPALGADYRLIPSLVVGEEYNDNLFQSASNAKTDFVTRVQPSLALNATGGGFSTDLSYGIDYRYFAKGSRKDQFDHRAAMKGSFGSPEDFLHLDLADTYSRVSSNVARDVVNESLVVNQTLQNNALISPYLTWHLPGGSKLKTGYRYRDVRYWEGDGIDKIEHDGYAEWSREIKAGMVLSAAYSYARVNSELAALDRHEVYAGLRYDYGTGNFLYGNLGYDWQYFDNGKSSSDPFWDLGAGRDFGVLTAVIGTKVQYTEDPQTIATRNVSHYATLSRNFPRGFASFNASYSKYDKQDLLVRDVQKKVLLGLSGRYELLQYLALTLNLSGDRLDRTIGTEYPYHLTGGLAVDYSLSQHLVLGANYSYISYRNDLGSTKGAVEVNRAIVEMRLSL